MAPRVFDFDDPIAYLKAHLKSLPREGFGEAAKIARALTIHPSLVTGILNGKNLLTPDQASELCDYLNFDEAEAEFFLTINQLSRAGTPSLERRLKRKLETLKSEAQNVRSRVGARAKLTEATKQVFYSQWYYSGLRMLVQLPGEQSIDTFAEHLKIPRATAARAIDFLLKNGLLEEQKNRYVLGPQKTHIAHDDPFVTRHHLNWREKSLAHVHAQADDELRFTGPLTIAEEDVAKVREILLAAIQDIFKLVDPSPSESAACLLIDWFRF